MINPLSRLSINNLPLRYRHYEQLLFILLFIYFNKEKNKKIIKCLSKTPAEEERVERIEPKKHVRQLYPRRILAQPFDRAKGCIEKENNCSGSSLRRSRTSVERVAGLRWGEAAARAVLRTAFCRCVRICSPNIDALFVKQALRLRTNKKKRPEVLGPSGRRVFRQAE